jgi:flagellar hook-length control protein FliK
VQAASTGPTSTGIRDTELGPHSPAHADDEARDTPPRIAAPAAPERRPSAGRQPSAAPPAGEVGHPAAQAAETAAAAAPPPAHPAPASAVSAPSPVAAAPSPAAQPALETALTRVRARGTGTHEVTVQLHPADLGAVRVVARLSGDQLDVTVLCADHAAQQAVAAAVPALHDRLSELKHVDITDLLGTSNQPAGSSGDGSHGRPQGGADRHPLTRPAESADHRAITNEPTVRQVRRAATADGRLDRRI